MPQYQGRWVALTPLPSSQSAAFALVIGSVAVLVALLSNKPGAGFILSIRDNMLASALPSWVTGQLQRLAALRVPSADIPASAPVICHKGAIRDLPPHAFSVLEGRAFSELRRGCDFIAYNREAFRRLLGPQPVIRELHVRSDAFAHEVSKCCHRRHCAQPPAPPFWVFAGAAAHQHLASICAQHGYPVSGPQQRALHCPVGLFGSSTRLLQSKPSMQMQ